MGEITIRDLSFTYPGSTRAALSEISLTVQAGEFLVLCGPSGCGKSTLLRQLKPELAPHGVKTGQILFEHIPLEELDHRTQAQKLGFVGQNPDDQIVTDKVWHELAFGLESLGFDTPAIRRRVAEMASFFGIEDWFYRDTTDLSGGQKQLLNLASVMVMQPQVLILDEPTSQLDPIAAADFLAVLGKINRELGTTIILVEHRLEEAFALATTVAVMDGEKLLCAGNPSQTGAYLKENAHGMFLAMPTAMRVWAAVQSDAQCPITVRDGRQWLGEYAAKHELKPVAPRQIPDCQDIIVLEAKELWFRYEKDAPDVLRGLSVRVHAGEFLALLGGNGAGKSTALKLLAGILKPYRGKVCCNRRVGVLPQDPQSLFIKKTLGEELRRVLGKGQEQQLEEMVRLCRLEPLLDRHPYDLSGGEQQRAALAMVLLSQPEILMLDEPTKGLDVQWKQEFAQILRQLSERGVSIVMVSHDIEFCAQYAHRCAMVFDGGVVTEAPPDVFFAGNSFYTTAANRMARGIAAQVITAEDLILLCGGTLPCQPEPNRDLPDKKTGGQPVNVLGVPRERKKLPKATVAAVIVFVLLIPVTLFAGQFFWSGRRYLMISLLLLLEMMVPFFLVFEGRRPQTRELVIIAVLCAIGVAGRAAFFMLPEFKPVWAITIVAGAALGGEAGFLVGAVTMLASNVMFSQGPWTPWQMFAMGLIGFLAGLLFGKGRLRPGRVQLCIYGALSCLCIYGGIMNTASALMWTAKPTTEILLSYFISGFPVDCIHAAATVLFLWLCAGPMMEKLDRVKTKWGLME